MAGDWIKMRSCLPDEPEVLGMAHALSVTPEHVCGSLLRVWGLGDAHAVSRICPVDSRTNEGHLSRYRPADIDRKAGLTGFALAMQAEGWLSVYEDGVSFPDWDEHHSNSAKVRACDQKLKRNNRRNGQNSGDDPDKCPGANRTETGPEKRREENKDRDPPLPPPEVPADTWPAWIGQSETIKLPFDTPAFISAWDQWVEHRKQKRQGLTPLSVKGQFEKMTAWGEARATAALHHSRSCGYQGLFEPKEGRPEKKGRTASILEAYAETQVPEVAQ